MHHPNGPQPEPGPVLQRFDFTTRQLSDIKLITCGVEASGGSGGSGAAADSGDGTEIDFKTLRSGPICLVTANLLVMSSLTRGCLFLIDLKTGLARLLAGRGVYQSVVDTENEAVRSMTAPPSGPLSSFYGWTMGMAVVTGNARDEPPSLYLSDGRMRCVRRLTLPPRWTVLPEL